MNYRTKAYNDCDITTLSCSVTSEVCSSIPPFSPSQLTLTTHHHTLNISWSAQDNVGIREFYVGVVSARNYSGRGLEMEYVCTSGQPHYSITDSNLLVNGNEFYVAVQAEDLTGHRTMVTFGPILIDLSPPLVNGSLQAQQTQGHVIVTWEEGAITEEEDVNGTITLLYAIGQYEVISSLPDCS